MKTLSLRAKLINCFFALTLVTGLCVPSIASYAYAEPTSASAGAAQMYVTAQTGDAASATPGQVTGSGNDQTSGDQGDQNQGGQDQTPVPGTPGVDQSGTDATNGSNGSNSDNAETTDSTTNPDEAVIEQQADQVQTFATDAQGYTDYNGLSIKGGTPETDYGFENVVYSCSGRWATEDSTSDNGRNIPASGTFSTTIPSIVIKANGAYHIKNKNGVDTATGTSIKVNAGVHADIIFEGVNISSNMPFNMVTNSTPIAGALTKEITGDEVGNKTTVYLTLADGTNNTLYSSYYASVSKDGSHISYQFPALRCGEGSVLTIDDSVRNATTSGKAITPEQGIIPGGLTYTDKDGKVKTSTGDGDDLESSLSNLESRNPGALNTYGGIRSAAIGGGPLENSGELIFNGGVITTRANGKAGDASKGDNGAGCGIGGGHAGGGTTTIFNGGTIDAYASYHGAAIGGGCTYVGGMSRNTQPTYPLPDAIISRNANSTIAGDIIINGGFVQAHGAWHSNAFGQGCGGTNTNHIILITGGTLLPEWGTNPAFLEIGGDGGYTIINGGSVHVSDKSKFQGIGGTAYSTKGISSWGDIPAGGLPAKDKVSMVTIDVTPKIKAMAESIGLNWATEQSKLLNTNLESWKFLLDKYPTDPPYGAPSRLDNGKLYLWLEENINADHQLDANFSYYVGDRLLSSKTTLPEGSTSGNQTPVVKEWEEFSLMDDPDHRVYIEQNWNKYYDGNPLARIDLKAHPISVNNPANGVLNNNDTIKYNFQKVNESGGTLDTATTSAETPADAAIYNIEVRSEQYKTATGFSDTYWGHIATGKAKISPVMSKTAWELTEPIKLQVTKADGTIEEHEYTKPTWAQDENAGNFNTATNNHLVVPVDITSWKLPFGDTYDDGSDMSRTSCLAPTGRLQLYIDGKAVPKGLGGVIEFDRAKLTDDTTSKVEKKVWIKTDASDNNREHVIAFFNLTRSQLEAFGLEDKSDAGNEHTVYVEYTSAAANAAPRDPATGGEAGGDAGTQAEGATALADDSSSTKDFVPAHNDSAYTNYYESQSDVSPVVIELTAPDFTLYNEANTGFIPGNTDQANTDKLIFVDDDAAHNAPVTAEGIMKGDKPGFQTDVSAYRDEKDAAGNVTATHDDWFPLYVKTNSIGNITFTSSNPSVISIEPVDKTTDREYVTNKTDYGIGAKAVVHSAGKTTITATINPTGAYSGATQSFDVYMFPDLAKEPKLEASMIARDDSRTDGSIRPGDTLVYTTTATNTTPDSALINPVYTLEIPATTELDKVEVYDAAGKKIDNPKYEFKDGTLTFNELPTLFGEESYKFVVTTTVTPDALKAEGDEAFACKASFDGIYGIRNDDFKWDNRLPAEGTQVPKAEASANPTLPDPNPTPKPQKPSAEEILGGDLVDPSPTDPDKDKPGVEVKMPNPDPDKPTTPDPNNPLGSDTPLGGATKADPDDPTKPADPKKPTNEPVKPGDRIIKFGGKDDPTTPDDISEELEKQIDDKLKEDPKATEVEIPVTIWTPDPTNPTDPEKGVKKNVIITVPIPEEYKEPDAVDPEDRDDHDLVVIPEDVDPRVDGDIKTTKTMENISDGFADRANKSVALVGDTIRYTITVENTKAGSAWYSAIVKDPLPKGLEYIPGTTKITLPNGQVVTDFKTDYAADAPTLGFCLGDIYGGEKASVSFEVKVAKGSQTDESQSNIAYSYGTEPSDTLIPNPTDPKDPDNPDDPDDPQRPIKQEKPDTPVGPYDPADDKKTWDDIDEETKKNIEEIYGSDKDEEGNPIPTVIPGTDPTPTTIEKIISSKPKHEELRITLSAQNETRTDGYTYVGDLVTYTIDIENLGDEDTNWLDVIARADIPQGLNFIPGSIMLTMADGTEINVADAAYNNQSRILALNVGNVPGQKAAKVVFRAEVTIDALNKDIGMTSYAYGTMPDEISEDYVPAEPGTAFVPAEGWMLFERTHFSISNVEKVYPSEYVTAQQHVKGTPEQEKLAKTGDTLGFIALGVGVIAAAAVVTLLVALRRIRKDK